MINLLLENADLSAPYLRDTLEKYLKPGMKAAVVPFSFRDSQAQSAAQWEQLYDADFRMPPLGVSLPNAKQRYTPLLWT